MIVTHTSACTCTWISRYRTWRLRRLSGWVALALTALLGGCGEPPTDPRTRPPVTLTTEGDTTTALVNLQNMGAPSVLQAIRGQSQLDGLDYTAPRSKPTPVRLPTAAPELGALLLFPEGVAYDPSDPAHVARMREVFEGKKPAALRMQAVGWVSARQDGRFLDSVAAEMKPGSLIAGTAAEALGGYAQTVYAPRARAALEGVLASPDYLIRAAAIRALGRIGDSGSLGVLRGRLAEEKHQYNRVLVCHALGYLCLHGRPAVAAGELRSVQEALRKPQSDVREDPLVRAEAAVALAATGDRPAVSFLKSLADFAAAPEMQYLGIEGLVVAGSSEAPLYVLAGLNHDSPLVWAGCLQLLGQLPLESILPALEKLVREGESRRAAPRAALALGWLRQDTALDWLPYLVVNGDTGERLLAMDLLGSFHRLEYAEVCAQHLNDPQPAIREGAARALYLMNATSYAGRIAEAAREGNPFTRGLLVEIAARLAHNAERGAERGPEQGAEQGAAAPMGGGVAGGRDVRGGSPDGRQLEQALARLQRANLEKLRLVGVALSRGEPVAAVFRDGEGREKTVLVGEYVYGGFALGGLKREAAVVNGRPEVGRERTGVVVALLDDGQTQAAYRQHEPPTISTVARPAGP